MSRRPVLPSALIAVALCACRAVLPFPDPVPEGADVESCHDYVDQDLDGAVDCADADCDGSCTEEPPRCADGRDNDLDGARDGLDPSCWHERALAVTRCATTEGTDATLSPGDEFGWTGHADRTEVEGRVAFAAITGEARAGWATPLSGRVEGTELRFRMWHQAHGLGAITLAPLSSVSEDLVVAPQAPFLRFEMNEELISVTAEGVAGLFTRMAHVIETHFDVHLRLGASSLLEITNPDGVVTPLTFRGPTTWREDEPLVLLFEASVESPAVAVGEIHVTRAAVEHCGRAVPEMDAAGENLLFDVARGPAGLCVLATVDPDDVEPRGVRVYESADGVRFEDRGLLAIEGVSLGASITWDASSSRWIGAIAGQDHPSLLLPTPEWVRRIEGSDCAHLAVGDALDLPLAGLEAQGMDYAILADGTHRLTFDYLAQAAARYGLRSFTTRDPLAGDVEVTTIDVGARYDTLRQRGAIPSIDALLGARVVWLESGGEVRLFRELERGAWIEEPTPVLGASPTPGQFDRGRVLAPRLVMEPPPDEAGASWLGRLFYSGTSGVSCGACGRIGSADVTVVP